MSSAAFTTELPEGYCERPVCEAPLRVNFAWTLAGNLVYAGCQWGMLVVLAKLGTPAMVGQFALGLAVTAPVIAFANLSLRAVQATDARRAYEFRDYFGLRLATTAAALVVISLVCNLMGYRGVAAAVILAVGVAKGIESISDVLFGLFQQRERFDLIAISQMLKGVLSLGAFSSALWAGGTVLAAVLGLAAAWVLALVAYDLRWTARVLSAKGLQIKKVPAAAGGCVRPSWRWDRMRKLAWLSAPLGATALLISLNSNIPRYFVERKLGQSDLGFFAAMAYLMVAQGVVVNALGQSASPRLARYHAHDERRNFLRLVGMLLAIVTLVGAVGLTIAVAAGKQLLSILYRPEYAEFHHTLVVLMTAALISNAASILGYAATAARSFRSQPAILGGSTIVLTGACYLLVPGGHLQGAALALAVNAAVQVAGFLGALLYALGIRRNAVSENPQT